MDELSDLYIPNARNFKIDLLRALEREGIVREECPREHYWVFSVLRPDILPCSLYNEYKELGEIRW